MRERDRLEGLELDGRKYENVSLRSGMGCGLV